MSAVDEAVLAPQRTGSEEREAGVIAEKAAALFLAIATQDTFENCRNRVAYSIAQRFVDRNGFVLRASMKDLDPFVQRARSGHLSAEELASWLHSKLVSRFDSPHVFRIFAALNTLAEVKEDLERIPGMHEETDRIDGVGYVVTQQAVSLLRLDSDWKQSLEDRFPAFSASWGDAFSPGR